MKGQTLILDIEQLKNRLQMPLPGTSVHQVMDPLRPNQRKWDHLGALPRWSAVMILLYQEEGIWKFPLIQRPVYEGLHSGQVALPGGKKDLEDIDLYATALRETQEEIGINPSDVTVLGQLTEIYIPPSNFNVRPVIGWMKKKPEFIPDNHEVAGIYSVAIHDLTNPQFISQQSIPIEPQTRMNVSCFKFGEVLIWGATAMILSELVSILNEKKV